MSKKNSSSFVISKGVCFLCGLPTGEWKTSKIGKPFYRCHSCRSLFYFNTTVALEAMKTIEREILSSKDKIRAAQERAVKYGAAISPVKPIPQKTEVKDERIESSI